MNYFAARGVALAAALLVAACGSGDENDDAGASTTVADAESPSTEPAADEALGTPTPASGEPVRVGLITESGSEAIGSQSELTETGAGIAAEYVNEYRGGLAGRPIELVICGTTGTPAGAADCANQMIEEDVAGVVWPFAAFGPQIVPIVTGAGIPIIGVTGASVEELTTPGVFVLTGGYPGTLGAYAAHAAEVGVGRYVNIVLDVPAATQAARQLGGLVFGNAGVEYEVVTAPPGTADLTPQLQAAVSGGAEAIGVTGDLAFCTSFLQAYRTLNLEVPIYIVAQCIDPTVIESLGDVLDGSIFATRVVSEGEDADVYAAMVAVYGDGDIDPDPNISAGIANGVGAVMNLWNLLEGHTGPLDAADITEAARSATDVEVWASGGITFTCDGSAVSILPNVCSAAFQIGTVNAEGQVDDLSPVDAAPLFSTGG